MYYGIQVVQKKVRRFYLILANDYEIKNISQKLPLKGDSRLDKCSDRFLAEFKKTLSYAKQIGVPLLIVRPNLPIYIYPSQKPNN